MSCVSSVTAKRYNNLAQHHTRLIHAAFAAAVVALGANLALAQTLPAVAPAVAPATAPATLPALEVTTILPPTTAETLPAPAKTFVGAITSNNVYVRSGPGQTFYELGKLNKGDLVKVVGQQAGWYLIAPPAGTTSYIAKEFVTLDATGKIGTTNTDYVRVRAASARSPASDYAVLAVLRKGATVTVVGTTEKYYTIVAPEKAYVFVSPQLVQATNAAYAEPTLQLPTGAAPVTPRVAATGPAAGTPADDTTLVVRAPATPTTEPAMGTTTMPAETEIAPPHKVVIVPPQPSNTYNADAETRFNALNAITQAEFQKPLLQRDMSGLLKGWQQLAAMTNLAPWIKDSCTARIETIEKWTRIQQIAKEGNLADDVAFQEKRAALQQEWKATEMKIAELQRNSPPLAEGELRTSNIVADKYALVDPGTGRVRAYITPSGEIDLSKLLGKNVAVYGTYEDETVPVKTIKVKGVRTFDAPSKAPATQP